jgi:hypothetical protein
MTRTAALNRQVPEQTGARRILLVTDHTSATPELLAYLRLRAAEGAVQFRVLIPNPAVAEAHLLNPLRHDKATAAERVLRDSLPELEAAADGRIIASVSVRHDPLEAVEELMLNEPVDEIVLLVTGSERSRWLHPSVAHRLRGLGRPLTSLAPSG